MVASDPPVGYSARTDLITLSAITHAEKPCVFVELLGMWVMEKTLEVGRFMWDLCEIYGIVLGFYGDEWGFF